MSATVLVELARGGWLTLALMMLLSRVVFQVHGVVWMRAFLDRWQTGGVKRIWGAVSLVYATLLVAGLAVHHGPLTAGDDLVLATLLAVLAADGAVNVLPAGFTTFKDRLQRAWVARTRGTGREGDRHLFGTVNALLAAGAAGVAAAVLLYRPPNAVTCSAAAAAAALLTATLIGASGGPSLGHR
jgi:hypothetical protein